MNYLLEAENLTFCLLLCLQAHFKVPKEAIQGSTHYFVMKFPKKDSFNKSHLIIHQILTLKIL